VARIRVGCIRLRARIGVVLTAFLGLAVMHGRFVWLGRTQHPPDQVENNGYPLSPLSGEEQVEGNLVACSFRCRAHVRVIVVAGQ
jgi:hypothetical protein